MAPNLPELANISTIRSRVSTWTLCPASRCSLPQTSTNPGVAGQVSPSQSNPQTSRNCLTPRWAWSAPRRAQHLAIATSGMSLTMGRPIVEASAIALTPPHCGLSLARTWRPRATGPTLIRWRIHDERGTCHLRRRLLLVHARPYPQARRRDLDEGGIHRRRRSERYLS